MDPQVVGKKFLDGLHADPQSYLDAYEKRFGNVLNADNAATLSPEYAASPAKYRAAVQPAAAEIRDRLFQKKLAEDAPPGKNFVVFTAGGNAAGKSTMAVNSGSAEAAHVVFDSTFSNVDHARSLVDQALDSGKPVLIQHVYRPIAEAFRGRLDRSRTEGRVVIVRQITAGRGEHGSGTPAGIRKRSEGSVSVFRQHGRNDTRIERYTRTKGLC